MLPNRRRRIGGRGEKRLAFGAESARAMTRCDATVSLLWRDQMILQWIDIWDADGHLTYFELMCCGRFSAESQQLYYRWTDIPPFGVKGPTYPVGVAMATIKGVPLQNSTWQIHARCVCLVADTDRPSDRFLALSVRRSSP